MWALNIWKEKATAVGRKRCLLFSQRFQSLSHPCHFQTQLPTAESQGWGKGVKLSFEINPTILTGGHLCRHPWRHLHLLLPQTLSLVPFHGFPDKNMKGFLHFPKMSSPLRNNVVTSKTTPNSWADTA